jgi:F-type H+-transporting ATPase subunit gamma
MARSASLVEFQSSVIWDAGRDAGSGAVTGRVEDGEGAGVAAGAMALAARVKTAAKHLMHSMLGTLKRKIRCFAKQGDAFYTRSARQTQACGRNQEKGAMAKARAIVKRRKSVRSTRKITKTMQMIATAKFQKSLKRAVGTKPFTRKVREVVADLVANAGDFKHTLIETADREKTGKALVLVIAGNRGLAGAYNGNVLRAAEKFLKEQESQGGTIELVTAGKKAYSYFTFVHRKIAHRYDRVIEATAFDQIRELADRMMKLYADGEIDSAHVVYMNFISAGVQKPDVLQLLPLSSVQQAASAKAPAGKAPGEPTPSPQVPVQYEFSPSPKELLDEMLPITVRTTLFQCFLDAVTSENVARMVAMKSATDNADKMVKALTMQYNRASQSQITTELSEIMGGVEAMKGA